MASEEREREKGGEVKGVSKEEEEEIEVYSEKRLSLDVYEDDQLADFSNVPNRSIEKAVSELKREDIVYIDFTNNRLTKIESLDRFVHLRRIDFRANQIIVLENLEHLHELVELDFYENHIETVPPLHFPLLRYLDLSFNRIRRFEGGVFEHLPKLRELYLVQNKISEIDDVFGPLAPTLETLELGANRIREIKNLDSLRNLKNLWLAKNKITDIKNLQQLTSLRVTIISNSN
jgi:protein phosphatase 1 regulatory subunit 7